MKKKTGAILLIAVLTVCMTAFSGCGAKTEFVPKRQREDQVIVYQDCDTVEFYYSLPEESAPVEIWVELTLDGSIELISPMTVGPGETVTEGKTPEEGGFTAFVPGIYRGRLLAFDLESGRLMERVQPLEVRVYASAGDPYEALGELPETEQEVPLEEGEQRTQYYHLLVYPKTEELLIGISGLMSERRDIDAEVWLHLDGEEILLARAEHVPPRSMWDVLDMEPGTADRLETDRLYDSIRVDVYYSDTGELYESVQGDLQVYVPGMKPFLWDDTGFD